MKKIFRLSILTFIAIISTFLFSGCNNDTQTNIIENTTDSTTESIENFTNYVVTAEMVNVRKEPNINSEILDSYYKNTLINATTTENEEWNKIKLDGPSYAYIYADFVSPISDEDYETYLDYQIKDKTKKYGVISEDYANIRSLPTTNSDIVALYRKNDTIEIFGKTQNDWYVIEHNEITCYISPNIITLLSKDEYDSYMTTPTYMYDDENSYNLLGSYSTDYSFSGYNREYNLEKAAESMNGMVIPANAMFNWCRDIGPCGKEEGFLESIEILNGEYVTGYGGGICQVSSTLCAAVIKSEGEFELIDRNKHAISQSYIPSELDATVSYPDCNFIFRNNNPFAIMIKTNCSTDNTITISIYQVDNIIL